MLEKLVRGLRDRGPPFGPEELAEQALAILGLGIGFLAASSVALGRKWSARSVAATCILVAVFMWLVLALYATVLPMVLRVVNNPIALTPIKKAAAKTGVQALIYPFALLWLCLLYTSDAADE